MASKSKDPISVVLLQRVPRPNAKDVLMSAAERAWHRSFQGADEKSRHFVVQESSEASEISSILKVPTFVKVGPYMLNLLHASVPYMPYMDHETLWQFLPQKAQYDAWLAHKGWVAIDSVPQPRSLCAEYFHGDAVVTASLAKIRAVGDSEGHFYSMVTRDTLRGTVPPHFRFWEEKSSGRATFDWKPGRTYLLFMWYLRDLWAWSIDGCGNSGPLPQESGVLKRLRSIPTQPGDALVEGLASLRETSIDPIPNVTITATMRRDGRVFRTATGPNGRFRLRLPPGMYRLKATRDGFDFSKPELLSYEDPRRLNLGAGSCAQVQFTADP